MLLPQRCMSRQILGIDHAPFSILACDSQTNRHIDRQAAELIDLHHRIDCPVIHEMLDLVDIETADARTKNIGLHFRPQRSAGQAARGAQHLDIRLQRLLDIRRRWCRSIEVQPDQASQ